MERKKNILIVEDELLIARDLSYLIEDMGYLCVGIAKNYERALYLFSSNEIDLILCDIKIDGEVDGISTVKEIMKIKEVPIIYLSAYSDYELVNRTAETPNYGYLVKPYNERSLAVAINLALNKFAELESKTEKNSINFLHQFTDREVEIIRLLAAGKSSAEISDILFISRQTVSKHRSNILKKSNCKSSAELLHKFYKQ